MPLMQDAPLGVCLRLWQGRAWAGGLCEHAAVVHAYQANYGFARRALAIDLTCKLRACAGMIGHTK